MAHYYISTAKWPVPTMDLNQAASTTRIALYRVLAELGGAEISLLPGRAVWVDVETLESVLAGSQ
jgi:hypothetical protein